MRTRLLIALLLPMALTRLSAGAAGDPAHLTVTRRFAVGGEGGYDYLAVEPGGARLFVTHGTRVEVITLATGAVSGSIAPTPGVHGVAFAPESGCGFTSNGGDRTVTQFDLATLAPRKVIKYTGVKPDAIIYDPATRTVFVANGDPKLGGDLTLIDAASGAITGTIDLGGKLEGLALDGRGHLFVAAEDRAVVHVVDTVSRKLVATWPLAPGTGPTGLAIDTARHRLFAACDNHLMVVLDSDDGHVVATPPIEADPDGAAYDPGTGLVFASCRAGVLSVIQQRDADHYDALPGVPTGLGARTLALDPEHFRIYVPTGEFDPATHRLKPGTFAILEVAP